MIVFHTAVSEGKVMLWGEVPAAQAKESSARRRGRPPGRSSSCRPYPYDAGAKRLMAALEEAGIAFLLDKAQTESMTAWLPTAGTEPLPSSPLIAEPPASKAKVALAPWLVTVLSLSTEQAVELLCTCQGKKTLASGVIIGPSLSLWTTALRFAGAIVARQHFLPGVDRENEVYRAVWRPVLIGTESEVLARLARSMPAVGRALVRSKDMSSPPEIPPTSVLSGFINRMVDYLVRPPAPTQHDLGKSPDKGTSAGKTRGKRSRKPISAAFNSLHDQWLHALRSSYGVMEGEPSELARFAAQVDEWQRQISILAASSFRLCFRLEEPESAAKIDGQWYIRYLLQAVKDPSLLIPAQEAWKSMRHQNSILMQGGFKAREYLLLSLGQACGLCPRIEASLKTSVPAGYELDTFGAYEFLTEKAAGLEQAGFGVLLPAWWTGKGTKLRLAARAQVQSPAMQGGGGLSLDQIIQFDWEVALGDEKLSLEELRALAQLKVPLVKVRGQWVQMSAEEIQAALDLWKKKAEGQASVREIVQMALGATKPKGGGGITFEGVSAKGWVADLLAQLEDRARLEELAAPEGFQGSLRPYQVRGYSWLHFLKQWGFGACLADDMGLGKTIQTLALIQQSWRMEADRRPVLLICPTSVVANWQKEASRFTPDLPVMVHHGLTRVKSAAFRKEAEKKAMVISSYALLHRDFEILKSVSWSEVILDEAQNIKNPLTKQAKAARSLAQATGESKLMPSRLALTGTPVENNVGDLWSIMEFLNPGLLGQQAEFKRAFFIPIQANRDPEAAERLKRLTGPFILRRLKTDKTIINDLPEKLEMKVFCNLTKEQASLYTAVVEEAQQGLDSAEGIQRKGLVLATLMKLKQVCNHPAQFLGDNSAIPGRSGKLARLTEMIEEILDVGDRALVFSQFAEMGQILKRHLQETFGREVLFLHGALTKKARDRMVERFQSDDDGPPVFILSLKAGGTGLNLTRASHVFHFDRWWNPAVENQATDRAFRIGQTKNVQVHKFLCAGTLEDKIDEMIERKKDIAQKVVGTGEGWLTELSTAELKELFALRKEAVGE